MPTWYQNLLWGKKQKEATDETENRKTLKLS